jgi:hypothetical protein
LGTQEAKRDLRKITNSTQESQTHDLIPEEKQRLGALLATHWFEYKSKDLQTSLSHSN